MCHRKTACFGTLVLEPHLIKYCAASCYFIYCLLGWQSSLQASSYLKMQNMKLPLYHLRAAYDPKPG